MQSFYPPETNSSRQTRTKQTSLFLILRLFSFISLMYLVLWKVIGIHTPIFQDIIGQDLLAIACAMIILIISLISICMVVRQTKYIFILLPILLVTCYCLDLLEGKSIYKIKGCEESVCTDLRLYKHGRFILYSESQVHSRFYKGYYHISGDTIKLYQKKKIRDQNSRKDIQLNKKLKKYSVYQCIDFDCRIY